MGTYDTIRVHDDSVKCSLGHSCCDLQTKDLNCDLDTYHVFRRRFYRMTALTTSGISLVSEAGDDAGKLVLTSASTAVWHDYIGSLDCCAFCCECEPLYSATRSWIEGNVSEQRELLEWRLHFDSGCLTKVEPIKVPTREESRADWIKQGHLLLADDDVMVLAHKKLKAREQEKAKAKGGSR